MMLGLAFGKKYPTEAPTLYPTITSDTQGDVTSNPTHKPTRNPTYQPTEATPVSSSPTISLQQTEYPTGFVKTTPPTPTDFNGATMAPTPTEMFPIELRTNPPTPSALYPPSLKTFAPSPTDMYVPTTPRPSPESTSEPSGSQEATDRPTTEVITSNPTGYPTDNSSWVNKTMWTDDYEYSEPSVVHIFSYSFPWTGVDTIITTVVCVFLALALIIYLFCCVYVQPGKLIEREGYGDPFIKNRQYSDVAAIRQQGASSLPTATASAAFQNERAPLLVRQNTNRKILRSLRSGEAAGGKGTETDDDSDVDKLSDFNI